jgi:hypothetical protein
MNENLIDILSPNRTLIFIPWKNYIFFIQVPKLGFMSPCTIVSNNIWGNLSCTTNLTCAAYGDYAGYCSCLPLYFYSSYCIPQYLNGVACTSNSQCRSDLGLFCNQTSGYLYCMCNTSSYWSTTSLVCLPKLSYQTVCTATIQCQTYLGLQCTGGRCE